MKRLQTLILATVALFCGVAAVSAQVGAETASKASHFTYFAFMSDPAFSMTERVLLFVVLGVAFAGLAYLGP